MATLVLLGSLLIAFGSVGATTVVQTATSIIPGTTSITATPTPAPSYSSSSSTCNWLGCGSSSCIPSTTKLIKYICEERCLNNSTATYTATTYPPLTTTLPCGGRFGKRMVEDELDLEKRWTCVQGPTITTTTSMACTDCTQFPTLTTVTKTSIATVTASCGTVFSSSSSPTKTITKTFSSATLTDDGCEVLCHSNTTPVVYIHLPLGSTTRPKGCVCQTVCI